MELDTGKMVPLKRQWFTPSKDLNLMQFSSNSRNYFSSQDINSKGKMFEPILRKNDNTQELAPVNDAYFECRHVWVLCHKKINYHFPP